MPALRLLTATLFASLCILPAAAQSAAAPTDSAKPVPALQLPPLSPGAAALFQQAPPPASPPLFVLPNKLHTPVLSASSGPCFTIRTYGYTARDLESNMPRPSSYSTCTPAATHTFKAVTTVTPGTPTPVK